MLDRGIEEIRDARSGAMIVSSEGTLKSSNSQITVKGYCQKKNRLTKSTVSVAGDRRSLTGLESNQSGVFSFTETILLEPGNQTLRFAAKAEGAGKEVQLQASYLPELPSIRIVSPATERLDHIAKEPNHLIRLEAKVDKSNTFPFQSRVFIDGQPSDVTL